MWRTLSRLVSADSTDQAPKLDPYVAQIDSWLAEDKTRPRKQRHTAWKIFERLRPSRQHGFAMRLPGDG